MNYFEYVKWITSTYSKVVRTVSSPKLTVEEIGQIMPEMLTRAFQGIHDGIETQSRITRVNSSAHHPGFFSVKISVTGSRYRTPEEVEAFNNRTTEGNRYYPGQKI